MTTKITATRLRERGYSKKNGFYHKRRLCRGNSTTALVSLVHNPLARYEGHDRIQDWNGFIQEWEVENGKTIGDKITMECTTISTLGHLRDWERLAFGQGSKRARPGWK